MNIYITKLKHILPTFLTIALTTIFGLLFFRWLFVIQFDLIDIKEEIWEFWIPIVFPWIPLLIWLRPKFRILTFKKDNDNGRFFFQVISAATIIASSMFSQNYLTTKTGKLETLKNIEEIDKKEKVRYYKIKDFNVAAYYGGAFTNFNTSGKHNQYLNFDLFIVAPILSDTSKGINNVPKYWYGVKYHEQISNRLDDEEKDKIYKIFYEKSITQWNNYNFHALDHFERKPTSSDREFFLKAIEARTIKPTNETYIVLEPKIETYESRNGNKLFWIFCSFGIGFSVLLFSLIWPSYNNNERNRQLAGIKPKQDDLVDMFNYLVPKGNHFVTSIILDLNILAFLIMILSGSHILSPSGLDLIHWGANRRPETINGEWWRLLTSMFLHGGIMHLILNISGLVIAAIFVEPLLDRKKYFILYILSGLFGSLASIWWYPNTISVGASGAIFGLYGAILGLLMTNAFPKEGKKGILTMIGIYVAVNLLWGLTGGIDNAAHIGGLLSGALIGVVLFKLDKGKKNAT